MEMNFLVEVRNQKKNILVGDANQNCAGLGQILVGVPNQNLFFWLKAPTRIFPIELARKDEIVSGWMP